MKYVTGTILVAIITGAIFLTLFDNSIKTDTDQQNSVSITPTIVSKKFEPYQATFFIFTNGTKRIFTAPMYHNLSGNVFITAEKPEVIFVNSDHSTWNDFFSSLPMGLTNTCLTTGTGQRFCTNESQTLMFYLNGKRVEEVLDREIQPNDQLLISFDNETSTRIQEQLDSFTQL